MRLWPCHLWGDITWVMGGMKKGIVKVESAVVYYPLFKYRSAPGIVVSRLE
jgi:hypothetical protein